MVAARLQALQINPWFHAAGPQSGLRTGRSREASRRRPNRVPIDAKCSALINFALLAWRTTSPMKRAPTSGGLRWACAPPGRGALRGPPTTLDGAAGPSSITDPDLRPTSPGPRLQRVRVPPGEGCAHPATPVSAFIPISRASWSLLASASAAITRPMPGRTAMISRDASTSRAPSVRLATAAPMPSSCASKPASRRTMTLAELSPRLRAQEARDPQPARKSR